LNWQQLKAILWLRWRLSRNQFARGGQVNAVLSVVMLVMLVLGAVAAAVGSVIGGAFAGAKAPPQVLLVIWDGIIFAFLVIWLSGLMVEIQRSESIDLTKLMHLPVTLRQVFVFNYLASHFTPGIVLLLPGMLGLCAGLVLGAGPAMVLLVPLVLSFVFMVTAWTYCVRGWLASLMANKRRRRAVVVWVTLVFVGFCQLPNVFFNSAFFHNYSRVNHRVHPAPGAVSSGQANPLALPEPVLQAHVALPPGWVGYGAMSLRQQQVWPALGAALASLLIGALGLGQAYRMTIRFYQGAEGRAKPRPEAVRVPGQPRRMLVERRLPLVPDDTGALALATLQSLLRTPELKMALVMPLVLTAVFISLRLTHAKLIMPGPFTVIAGSVIAVVSVFTVAPMMANAFGLDRDGFRALVLLPTRRHHILLAKNLAFLPFVGSVAVIGVSAAKLVLGLTWETYLAGLLQAGIAFMLFSLLCNLLSILAPFRLATGTLQAKKPKAIVFVAVLVTMLCMPVIMVPLLIPAGLRILFNAFDWVPWLPVNLLATLGLVVLAGCLYWQVLPFEGRLLAQREQTILREVTEEAE
jgi:ABC-2 type transport system permease protein